MKTTAKPTPEHWLARPEVQRRDWEPFTPGGCVDLGYRQIHGMTCDDAILIAEAGTVYHETGLSPRELLEQRDNLLEWLDTLTLVVGLTPIAGNKEALQEAMNGARAAIAATKPEAVKGGEG